MTGLFYTKSSIVPPRSPGSLLCLWLIAMLSALVSLCGAPSVQIDGNPWIRTYTSKETNSEVFGWCASQSPDGSLFFGSNQLVEFDGERWLLHRIDNAYGIRSIRFDSLGRVWIASFNELGYFERINGQTGGFTSLKARFSAEAQEDGDFWDVFPDRDGITAITAQSILRWNGQTVQRWPMPGKQHLIGIVAGPDFYVHHLDSGLWDASKGEPKLVLPRELISDDGILWLEHTQDRWLLATVRGFKEVLQGKCTPVMPEASAFIQRIS